MLAAVNASATVTRVYSPLTMSLEWSRVGRLLFVLVCTCLGTIMNGFFVATFFVESSLKKVGNVFHACVGLSDLIITTAIMPTCAVVLVSGEWDIQPLCYLLHFLAVSSTYCYSIFFMLVAAENYVRICKTPEEYTAFLNRDIGLLAFSVFALCFIIAGVGVFLKFDYNYCTRENFGNLKFRIATAVVFQGLPFIITMYGLIAAYLHVRRRARKHIQYKRSYEFESDSSSTALNISAYILFVGAWTPYLFIVHEFPRTSDHNFYTCVWIGLGRSVLSSFFYAFLNRNFRRAFGRLFNYFFCKHSLSSSLSSHHRRALEHRYTDGEVRVHIMHSAIANPPRFPGSSRATHEL